MRAHLLHSSLVALLAISAWTVPEAHAELSCEQVPEFARLFLRHHVAHNELDAEIEARAIANLVIQMDRSRSLLTVSEEQTLRQSLTGIFDDLRAGRCRRLVDVHKQFVRRHEQIAKFARATVTAESYEIDNSASLILDPEERGYPATAEARDDLWLRMIHFQMSNYVTNGTELKEAKHKLVKRYERRLKRALEDTSDEVYSGFLDAFASALDPHSNYLSARVLEDFRIGMSLSLEGIGVALSEQDGYSVAERIIPGGAADEHGVLKPKDKIIAVSEDGEDFVDIIDMPLRDAVSLIRGKAGTTVHLTILRHEGGEAERLNIEIVRAKIDLAEQAAKLRFEERDVDGQTYKLAILSLPSFYGDADPSKRQCTDDVEKLLAQVREEGADGLLLDLSRNGGGLLQHAVTISGFFISEGEVVGIEDSRGRRQVLSDRNDEVLFAGPMVVHTSRVSASAAEILAGALKDYGRAVIVGDDHTFGKGTVQTVSQLPGDNGALKVTTALFFRPGGHSTQHTGVDADVVLPSVLSSDDYGEQAQRFSLPSKKTSPFLGDDANSDAAAAHWDPVRDEVLFVLAERSAGRVAESEEFAEIQERVAEAEKRGGVVVLSELLERREEEEADARTQSENGDEPADAEPTETQAEQKEPTSPQLEEALEVLTDLVSLQHRQAAVSEEARPES